SKTREEQIEESYADPATVVLSAIFSGKNPSQETQSKGLVRRIEDCFANLAATENPSIKNHQPEWPVYGTTINNVVSFYGDPRSHGSHEGIDIKAPRGTPVRAAVSGIIEAERFGKAPTSGYRLWLHGEGKSFFYAHLDGYASNIGPGTRVEKGQVLGYVGNTGNARNRPSHLHYQVHVGNRTIDPLSLYNS
ncbi:MAG: M23 family metallopeptidase, partial [Candidatus Woesearchaeota archaeon]